MSKSLVEINPQEYKIIQTNTEININDLILKIKEFIDIFYVKINNDYIRFNTSDSNLKNTLLPVKTLILIKNRNLYQKFNIDLDFTIIELSQDEIETIKTNSMPKINEDDKKNILNNWYAESVKAINIPLEKQSSIFPQFREGWMSTMDINHDNYLSLIEECSSNSRSGNISFRFYFTEGKDYLKPFHYQLFLILKRFTEKIIYGHKHFKESHYNLDIFVFVSRMKDKHLGSALIHKYVKNEDNNLILPTKAVLKVNQKYLSKNIDDPVNVRLIQTLFHELLHCLGFGYWSLYAKNIVQKKYLNEFIASENILISNKPLSYYRAFLGDNNLIGIPLTEDLTHFNIYNYPVLKNNKLFGVLPGLKYELMSTNETKINLFSKISAAVIEELGYCVNYEFCDDYFFSELPDYLTVEYTNTSQNHFAYGLEKYMLLLKTNNDTLISGIETFSMYENRIYRIHNKHSYSVYVVKSLEESEDNLLTQKDGVTYEDNVIIINPTMTTPGIFYIVSSITFGGIPIVKANSLEKISHKNCYNQFSLKKVVTEFIEGKNSKFI